jgi:hypothetical protein
MTFKIGQWCIRCTQEGHQSYECKQPVPPKDPPPTPIKQVPVPPTADPYDGWNSGCFIKETP